MNTVVCLAIRSRPGCWHMLAALCICAIALTAFGAVGSDTTRALGDAARALWEARVTEDWDKVYDFLPEERRAQMPRDEFVSYQREKGPFRFLSAEVEEFHTDGDMGWVAVAFSARARAYPQLPPTRVETWNTWRLQAGRWSVLSKDERDQYPRLPTAHRSTTEERQLADRANEFWYAKQRRDWAIIHGYLEPDYQARVPLSEFLKRKAMFAYLDHRLEWAEVIGNDGRVKIAYSHKLDDPSLAKMEPSESTGIEAWIKVDEQWFRRMEALEGSENR